MGKVCLWRTTGAAAIVSHGHDGEHSTRPCNFLASKMMTDKQPAKLLPSNLELLHANEEIVRTQSIEAATEDAALSDHLHAVHDAMNHIMVLLGVPSVAGEAEHTVQLLAMRVFNVGAGVLKLGFSGYYQAAFTLLRDALETVNLVDLFRVDGTALVRWQAADEKTLKNDFGPAKVRLALEKHPEFKGQRRDKQYATFSGYASHASYRGFKLIAPDNWPQPGPFFDITLLRALLEDLGRHLAHVTIAISTLIGTEGGATLEAKAIYLTKLGAYREKHLR